MKSKNRREYITRAIDWQRHNLQNELSQAQTVIRVSETHRWDYAIPENYTNYQDGFLYPDTPPIAALRFLISTGRGYTYDASSNIPIFGPEK